MTNKEMVQSLLNNGFKKKERLVSKNREEVLVKKLDSSGDRFSTDLYVYTDEPDKVYINRFLTRGLETISESDMLENHNNLNSSQKDEYIKTVEKLPFLKSAL